MLVQEGAESFFDAVLHAVEEDQSQLWTDVVSIDRVEHEIEDSRACQRLRLVLGRDLADEIEVEGTFVDGLVDVGLPAHGADVQARVDVGSIGLLQFPETCLGIRDPSVKCDGDTVVEITDGVVEIGAAKVAPAYQNPQGNLVQPEQVGEYLGRGGQAVAKVVGFHVRAFLEIDPCLEVAGLGEDVRFADLVLFVELADRRPVAEIGLVLFQLCVSRVVLGKGRHDFGKGTVGRRLDLGEMYRQTVCPVQARKVMVQDTLAFIVGDNVVQDEEDAVLGSVVLDESQVPQGRIQGRGSGQEIIPHEPIHGFEHGLVGFGTVRGKIDHRQVR